MPERRDPPPTEEGWYALHDFRTVDWDAWRDAPDRVRERALDDAVSHLGSAAAVEDADEGATAVYAILGHKADLLILHLRPSTADLDALERRFEATEFADFTDRSTSYVSVTEASGYSERARGFFDGDLDPESGLAKYIRSRLYPAVPDAEHVCFYPMDKRRDPEQNWYDLPFDERAEHMDSHGDIGRNYGGKVSQMITGSMGLDDREWGVTLWADDLTDVKDLLYEMRFDPSTAQFAEFGSFYVGRRFPPADLPAFLAGDRVPADEADARADSDAAESATASRDPAPVDRADSERGNGHAVGGDADAGDGSHPGSAAEGDHPHGEAAATDDQPRGADDAGDGADSETDDGEGSRGRPDVSSDVQEVDDVDARLTTLGLQAGADYDAGDYAVVCYSDADASELAEETDELAGNFDHYDRHVGTYVRAQQGNAAAVSVWTAKDAAETAAGFMGDLPGVTEIVGGPLGHPDAADGAGGRGDDGRDSTGASAEAATDVREVLAERNIYAGQPHGEDVYALVLYSQADHGDLFDTVADLRENFEHYDSHVKTAVYENPDTDTAAVVSLWETDSAAEKASDFLGDLPGIVGGPEDVDGFGTMGMFYTVKPEHREEFVGKFEEVGTVLEDVEGHRESALLVNREDENDMFIASRWDSQDDAVGFFRSEAFSQTVDWGRDILADRPRHVFLA